MTYRLNAREKVMAFIVGGALLFILNLFVLRFFFGTQAQLSRDQQRLEGQLRAMRNLLANTALWEERDAWLRSTQPVLENEARAGSDLLTQVQELSKKHTVIVEQPAIANPDRHPEYTAVSVSVETKSTWKSLIQFLHALQGPDQFVVLESAELKIDPQDQTQMRGRFKIAKWFAPKS
jgi:hypothetical protein